MPAKKPHGRPTIMTPEVIAKLEEAFAWGCTDIEACLWANIAIQTLYKYQEREPSFVERKASLKETPVLLSRKALVNAIKKGDRISALAYLERKKKDEFSTRSEHTGKDGEQLMPTPIYGGQSKKDGDATQS